MDGNETEKLDDYVASVFKLMFFVGRNKDGVARYKRSFVIFADYKAVAF